LVQAQELALRRRLNNTMGGERLTLLGHTLPQELERWAAWLPCRFFQCLHGFCLPEQAP